MNPYCPHGHLNPDHSDPIPTPHPRTLPLSVLDQLQTAYQLITQALDRAPQLHDCHLNHALLLLLISLKRARRSPRLRPPPPCNSQQHFDFD